MWTPFMSAYEPAGRADGSIDPLGLQADASRVADLLLPGFTVRVDRLRALTLATLITQLARSAASEQQLAYRIALERVFLSTLIANRPSTLDPAVRGFPGRLKARTAHLQGHQLTLERYIKGPATNGLVGAYTTLARWSALLGEDTAVLGDGDELLKKWETAAGQRGFAFDPTNGLRKLVDKVVRKDLESKSFDPRAALVEPLFPIIRLDRTGAEEKRALSDALGNAGANPQRAVLECLRAELPRFRKWTSSDDKDDTDAAERDSRGAFERAIVDEWAQHDGDSLETDSIAVAARMALAYEHTSVLLTAAFDAIRWRAAQAAGNAIGVADVVVSTPARRVLDAVLDELPSALSNLECRCTAIESCSSRFKAWQKKPGEVATSTKELIVHFSNAKTPGALLDLVIERHRDVQDNKRKGYWLLADGTRFRVLGGYQLVAAAPHAPSEQFMHAFRLVNALSILSDLEG